jgi:F-type H+-transporting ATPase subunit delta
VASRIASANRYAEAAFEIASGAGTADAWSRDLATIAEFVSDPQVAGLLASGRVPREEKLRLLSAGLEASISPLAWNLTRILEQRGKTDLAPEILRGFRERHDAQRGVAHAVVTTAVPLSDDEQRTVASRLSQITGKQVDISTVVDESIIGGLVARIGDELIDGSTRSRLVALKRRLEGAVR